VVSGLESGVKYYFKAEAIDSRNLNQGNVSHNNRVLATTTIWVGPSVYNLQVQASPAGYSYQKILSFKNVHPKAGQPGVRVALDELEYSLNGGRDWVAIGHQYIVGDDLNNLRTGNSVNSAGESSLLVDTLAYFQGQQNVVFRISTKDQAGLISPKLASDGTTVSFGSGFGGMGRNGIAGGCIGAGNMMSLENQPSDFPWSVTAFFSFIALGLWFLRRRFLISH
jgi:hypothetical protein